MYRVVNSSKNIFYSLRLVVCAGKGWRFFLSLQCLRKAAASSPGMERCGKFLAEQKTNIRYLSLTFGGHIFGVLLSFGSISLLGSLAEKGSQQELDPELRKIKRKSMLIAVQRGFIAMTCWSPLTYSIAITTSIIPGSSWNGAAFSCVISALILIFLGWIIDSRNNGKNKKQISAKIGIKKKKAFIDDSHESTVARPR